MLMWAVLLGLVIGVAYVALIGFAIWLLWHGVKRDA